MDRSSLLPADIQLLEDGSADDDSDPIVAAAIDVLTDSRRAQGLNRCDCAGEISSPTWHEILIFLVCYVLGLLLDVIRFFRD